MIYSSFFLYLILVHNVGSAVKYITNFKFEEIVFGKENLMKDYVTLANDPNGNLPNSYTVCSSVYVKFCTSNYGVLTMLKNDGSPWYLVEIFKTSRQYETKSEKTPVTAGTRQRTVATGTGLSAQSLLPSV